MSIKAEQPALCLSMSGAVSPGRIQTQPARLGSQSAHQRYSRSLLCPPDGRHD